MPKIGFLTKASLFLAQCNIRRGERIQWMLVLLACVFVTPLLCVAQQASAQEQPLFYYDNGRRIAVQPDHRSWTVGKRVNHSPQTLSPQNGPAISKNQPPLTPPAGWQVNVTTTLSSGDLMHIWKNPSAPMPQTTGTIQGKTLFNADKSQTPQPRPAAPTPLDNANVEWAYPGLLEEGFAVPSHVSPEVVVQVRPGMTLTQLRAQFPDWVEWIKMIAGVETLHLVRLRSPRKMHPITAANRLLDEFDWVVNAQPNFLRKRKAQFTPNDPLYPQQWHLNNPYNSTSIGGGLSLNGGDYTDHDSRIEGAWDTSLGDPSVVIAVIDGGVEVNHPDLRVVPGISRNYCTGGGFPSTTILPDDHGTSVAGVAAGRGDNGIGLSGACPNCSVLGVQIFFPTSSALCPLFDSDIATALAYAAQHADVLTNSWSSASASRVGFVLRTVIRHIHNGTLANMKRAGLGAPIVFAAGNAASHWQGVTLTPGGSAFNVNVTMRYIQSGIPNTARVPGHTLLNTAIVSNILEVDSTNRLVKHHHRFEDCRLPSGFGGTADSTAGWAITADNGLTDSTFGGRCSLRAGSVGLNQSSEVEFSLNISAGNAVYFRYWVSSHRLTCQTPNCFNPSVAAAVATGNACAGQDRLEITAQRGTGSEERFITCGYASADDDPVVQGRLSPEATLPETISVGAVSIHNTRSGYSQWGADLDVVAHSNGGIVFPAGQTHSVGGIVSTDTSSGYTTNFGGTSAAAPLIAGILGLYLSQYPHATAQQAKRALLQTARKIGSVPYVNSRNAFYGGGLVDAARMLQTHPPSVIEVRDGGGSEGEGCILTGLSQAGYLSKAQLDHLRKVGDWLQAQGYWGKRAVRLYYQFSNWVQHARHS